MLLVSCLPSRLATKQMIVRFINKCECQKRKNEQIQKVELAAWLIKGGHDRLKNFEKKKTNFPNASPIASWCKWRTILVHCPGVITPCLDIRYEPINHS